jgi:hypothetical protein
MNKHTPGPWTIGAEDEYAVEVQTGPVSVSLDRHEVPSCDMRLAISREEMLANARLIAAAPDLLRELEATTDLLESLLFGRVPRDPAQAGAHSLMKLMVERHRTAIKKAKGEK